MRWRTNQIPQSLQQADPEVRGRALSIAERMVREGEEKARALFEGLERAQNMGEAETSITRVPAEREFHVVASGDGWELRSEDQSAASREFGTRDEALSHGHDKARKVQGNLYIHRSDGSLNEIVNFFEEESIRLGTAAGEARALGQPAGEPEPAGLESMEELYIDQLEDLYSAERQLVGAFEKVWAEASNADFREVIKLYSDEPREHREKLDEIFADFGRTGGNRTSPGIAGIIEEAEQFISRCDDPDVCDAGLIGYLQRAKHYEIAVYGTARTYAKRLDRTDDVEMLDALLDEEKETDRELTEIAERSINPKASGEV